MEQWSNYRYAQIFFYLIWIFNFHAITPNLAICVELIIQYIILLSIEIKSSILKDKRNKNSRFKLDFSAPKSS
jgi:hypothetical protein